MPLVLRVCVLRRTWQSHCTSVQVGWIRHYFLQDFSPSIGREETGCSRHISIRHTSEEKFDSGEGLTSCQLLYLTTHTYTHQFLFFSKLNLNSPLTLASFQIFLSDAIEHNTINLLLPPTISKCCFRRQEWAIKTDFYKNCQFDCKKHG